VSAYPTPDECFARLHRAGWSVGEASFLGPAGEVWKVSGSNGGGNLLPARMPRPGRCSEVRHVR
jgi:hypothetical protein